MSRTTTAVDAVAELDDQLLGYGLLVVSAILFVAPATVLTPQWITALGMWAGVRMADPT